VLQVIAERPAVRAAELAAGFGRETQPFKLDVRKLKNLGLTISLERGYRLSPRGQAYLAGVNRDGGPGSTRPRGRA
jgi:predicted DNA-binding transcriptional regulator YafY